MKFPLIGIFIFSTALALHAQITSPTKAPGLLDLEFTLIAWESPLTDASLLRNGKPEPLAIPVFARSETYRYQGPNPLTFSRPAAVGAPAGTPPVVSEIVIPSGWHRAIILVFPKPDHSLALMPVQDDIGHFPEGSVRVFNATREKAAVRAKLLNETAEINPGEAHIFTPQAGTKKMPLIFARPDPAGWHIVTSYFGWVDAPDRLTVFVTRTNAAMFRQVVDGHMAEPEELQVFAINDPVKPAPSAPAPPNNKER